MSYKMNNVQIAGNLARNPKIKKVTNDQKETVIANFTVAVNRAGKDQPADFIDVTAIGSRASFVEKYLKKGTAVQIEGTYVVDQYEKDGQKMSKVKVLARDVNTEKNGALRFNLISTIGHLTKDPEVRVAKEGKKASVRFTLGVQRPYSSRKNKEEDETDFISYVAFDKNAELIGKYLKKGSCIAVTGEIRTSSYKKEGDDNVIYRTEVLAQKISFATAKDKKETAPENSQSGAQEEQPSKAQDGQQAQNPAVGQADGNGQHVQPAVPQGQPVYVRDQYGNVMYGQPVYPQGQYGQPVYSQGQYGQPVYPQGQYGQPLYPQGQYGQPVYPQGQYGQPVYPQGQYGQPVMPQQPVPAQGQQAAPAAAPQPVENADAETDTADDPFVNPYDPDNIFGGYDGVMFD